MVSSLLTILRLWGNGQFEHIKIMVLTNEKSYD